MNSHGLEQYLNDGITKLINDILRSTLNNPKAAAFFAKYALASKKAQKRRHTLEKQGEHIPSFLIASITTACNLNCAGCYDKANQSYKTNTEMNANEWSDIFMQSDDIGISAILLAGGEPLMRADVMQEAAKFPSILFPVFTNGTMLNEENMTLFYEHRNLIPIISIEGDQAQTDTRRGNGIYSKTMETMNRFSQNDLLFGASITVTSENIQNVTSSSFLNDLSNKGCKAVVFVEYVPVENAELALDDGMRSYLEERVEVLRAQEGMIIISFPGDEQHSGGCLAAGRGFFHINAAGGAEPCPFSPYSDTTLKKVSVREALKSPLFSSLKENGLLAKEHVGGCALFHQAEEIEKLIIV